MPGCGWPPCGKSSSIWLCQSCSIYLRDVSIPSLWILVVGRSRNAPCVFGAEARRGRQVPRTWNCDGHELPCESQELKKPQLSHLSSPITPLTGKKLASRWRVRVTWKACYDEVGYNFSPICQWFHPESITAWVNIKVLLVTDKLGYNNWPS